MDKGKAIEILQKIYNELAFLRDNYDEFIKEGTYNQRLELVREVY